MKLPMYPAPPVMRTVPTGAMIVVRGIKRGGNVYVVERDSDVRCKYLGGVQGD